MPRKRTPDLLVLSVFLLPLLTSHEVGAAEFTIKPVVLTGDPAPEGGSFVNLLTFAANNLGAIAFSGRTNAFLPFGGFGLYLAAEGRITRLVKPGDPIRGSCDAFFNLLGISFVTAVPLFMSDSGDIVFFAVSHSPGRDDPALFSGGASTLLGVCPNIFGSGLIFSPFVTAMNNTGTIALQFETLGPGQQLGTQHFLVRGGTPTLLPLQGTPAPGGGTIARATIRAISDSGDLLVHFSAGITFPPDPRAPSGFFIETGSSRIPIALSGGPAREGTTFRQFGAATSDMNNLGQVVFVAELSDFRWAIFRRNPDGTLTSLVHQDDPATGGGLFGSALGGSFLEINVDINDKGDIAFGSHLGIFFLSAEGMLSKVVRRGDAAPRGGNFGLVGPGRVNNKREIAFQSNLSTGQTGIFLASPGGLEMEFVDPVPELLPELTLTAEEGKARLATMGRVVGGVAADGVARVVVRVKAPDPGTVELTLVDAAGMPLAPAEEAGFPTHIGDTVGSNSLFAPTVAVPDKGPMAFAVYHAPSRFVRAGSGDANQKDRQVSLRARFTPQTGGAAQEATIPITIARPPVVLVHGLWGSRNSWDLFVPLTTDQRFFVQLANYPDTNAAGFAVNAPIVGREIQRGIERYREARQVAAVQADVVAHSMGGLLVRRLPLLGETYFRADNFEQGNVHRLINIATPHFGSRLANILLGKLNRPRCVRRFRNNGVPIDEGAIHDLSPGSARLGETNRAASPLRLHNIVGIASAHQKEVNASGVLISTLQSPLVCGRILPPGGFDAVFRDDNDLIVAATSQRARLSPASPAVSTFAPLIHTRAGDVFDVADGAAELESAVVSQEVLELLNLPMNDAKFPRLPPQ